MIEEGEDGGKEISNYGKSPASLVPQGAMSISLINSTC